MHSDNAVKQRRYIRRFACGLSLVLSFGLLAAACGNGGNADPENAAPGFAASGTEANDSGSSPSSSEDTVNAPTRNKSSESAALNQAPLAPEIASFQVPIADEGSAKKDNSIRAIGASKDGRLLVQPLSDAYAGALGAPSCYGTETDVEWSGTYQAVWEPKAAGKTTEVIAFPAGFTIIQPGDAPVQMQRESAGDTELFFYAPRYADCHGLEAYVFGVRDGKAFPVSVRMGGDEVLGYFTYDPGRPYEYRDGELTVWGSPGAGSDSIDVYRYRYSDKDRSLILTSTGQTAPSASS
ncbi:hypothetical protein [Cohnella sp. AR92]|uniref:hypothetical protein n=1 Tax=Cohnella sp. AR92 TaxID=648716 RepID=UPI000F8CB6CB|nr:hypothetical protein [Cohnella sp. AR92]RUS45075.1 hypothetical protein ELR57_21305 [Cohnella sp. AR92]